MNVALMSSHKYFMYILEESTSKHDNANCQLKSFNFKINKRVDFQRVVKSVFLMINIIMYGLFVVTVWAHGHMLTLFVCKKSQNQMMIWPCKIYHTYRLLNGFCRITYYISPRALAFGLISAKG